MKAWLLHEKKGVESMKLEEVERPKLNEGEVLVRVEYAALNPADYYLAQGLYPAKPKMPHVLGRDAMGVVEEIGDGVDKCQAGERVVILRGPIGVERWGTFAEYVAVPSDLLVHVPEGWSEKQAAGAPLVYLTAFQALNQWGEMQKQNLLITGATGGVGIASLQLGKAYTHNVICLTRSKEKGNTLKDMGADLVLDPSDPDLVGKIREFTGKEGVCLAVDNVGGELFNKLLDVMGPHGTISCVGQLAGAVPEFRTGKLFFKRIRIGGVAVGTYSRDEAKANWQEILSLLETVNARPLVDEVFELDKLQDAFARLKSGVLGKVLIKAS